MKVRELDRYVRKVRKNRKSWLRNEIKLIRLCFRCLQRIDFPKSDKDADNIKTIIEVYDEHIALIEKDFISKKRWYIQ